jgi:hypothetical protein
MQVNQGLSSRFSKVIKFSPFTLEDSCTLLCKLLKKDNFTLDAEASENLPSLMTQLVQKQNFSNGRGIQRIECTLEAGKLSITLSSLFPLVPSRFISFFLVFSRFLSFSLVFSRVRSCLFSFVLVLVCSRLLIKIFH